MRAAGQLRGRAPVAAPLADRGPGDGRLLLTRCEGTIGELSTLLADAAVAAIETGEEAINQRTLLLAGYAGVTERRRTFERELT
ncbi:hypothetical protein [Nocardia fluminea]